MSNEVPNTKKPFDLEERTALLGEEVIDFVKSLKPSIILSPLISQLIRSATSVGANYMEADATSTKKDFNSKITICRKEAKETMHWLRMIAKAEPNLAVNARIIWQEAQELTMIFSKILNH